jgi:hypothetical protein
MIAQCVQLLLDRRGLDHDPFKPGPQTLVFMLRNWEKKRTIDHCLSPLRYELITFGSADCALSKLVRKL